jgi:Ino eighty subunit 1
VPAAVVPAVRRLAPRQRKSLGKEKAKVEVVEDADVTMMEDGEDDGGGDLDDEDRELLGEVDADADESEEDEDEIMGDE